MSAPFARINNSTHTHMDGAFALISILPQLYDMAKIEFPFNRWGNYHKEIKKLFYEPQGDIVQLFSNITKVMQTKEALILVAATFTRFHARQGFRYCEATIAPQYHTKAGLTEEEVIRALVKGIKIGEREYPEIEMNIIFTIGREASPEEGVRLVEAASRCNRNYVVGIGLACDEAGYPPQRHIPAFRRAKELGFKTTAHAGEWASADLNAEMYEAQLVENIRCAIFDLEVDRIGHAIPLGRHPELISEVVKRGVGIEGCPGSNLASELIPNMKYLKIRDMLQAGVLYFINADDDLFLPDINETYWLCDEEYDFSDEEKAQMIKNSWLTRFGRRKYQSPVL
ncbi:MAG: hypothetical protein KGJ89_00295 [Patescibacteria group bacterium]|nr:hypothetical protein [Patescibacteria group bacterium]MDE2014960.1 hypothetical protein [Patescibacteria group bacterium]MDE2226389.1 hypothetical protein [Patescibacteria group bacterium]